VQQKIEVNKTYTGNAHYEKDHARFWGVTPPQSQGRASSVQSKSTVGRRNPELVRNAARFFQGKPSSNPDDD